MASISTNADGRRRILFVAKDGSRKTIYLGRMPKKMVDGLLVRVEQLVSSSSSSRRASAAIPSMM